MDYIKVELNTKSAEAHLLYWINPESLPHTIYCPHCREFLMKILEPARGTLRMNCAECGKEVYLTFAGISRQ